MRCEYIICDPDKCVGCEICELVCSAIKEKSFNTAFSRIHTAHLPINEPVSSMSITCFHCEDPACVKACPRQALYADEETGKILVRTELIGEGLVCVPCGYCTTACEFGGMILHPRQLLVPIAKNTMVAAVCDLCPEDRFDGEPPCVRFCPKDALSLATIEEVIQKSESQAAKKLLHELSKARKESKTFYERLGYISRNNT